MPAVKVKENEPFDVALRRFKLPAKKRVYFLKYVVASTTRSRPLFVSAKQPLPLSVISRSFSGNSASSSVCTKLYRRRLTAKH